MKKIIIFLVIIVLLIFVFFIFKDVRDNNKVETNNINSFEECAEAGYPIMESYPERCVTPNGLSFTRIIKDDEGNIKKEIEIASSCEEQGGIWLEEFFECEYINEIWCQENNGNFFECESACRHNQDSKFCTMQCVHVCIIK